MTDTPKLNLRQKLIEVYKRVDHVEKAGHNAKQNYDFVRAADVMRAIRDSFAELGIYAETNYDLLATYDIKTNSGGVMHTATVKATIKLYDANSDETKTISGLGDGADGGDKGIFKAQTGATKNALRNGTLLPDEADPEADLKVDELTEQGSGSRQDDLPDFQEARHAAPRPAATQKAQDPAKRPDGPPAAAVAGPVAPPPPPVPTEKQNQGPAVAPDSTQAQREAGDESDLPAFGLALPTEEELTVYRTKFSKLGDELSTEGKLKSSKGLPINRKLLVFLLSVTKADDAKNITKAQWDDFFNRVQVAIGLETGLVGLAKLVNKANGIEDKPKK